MDDFSQKVADYLKEAGFKFTDLYLLMDSPDGANQLVNNWVTRKKIPVHHRDNILRKMGVWEYRSWFRDGDGQKPPISAVLSTLGQLKAGTGRGKKRAVQSGSVVLMPKRPSKWPFSAELLQALESAPLDRVWVYENQIRLDLGLPLLGNANGNSSANSQ